MIIALYASLLGIPLSVDGKKEFVKFNNSHFLDSPLMVLLHRGRTSQDLYCTLILQIYTSDLC